MADHIKLQPLFLLSDEPIGLSRDDGLGMNQTARVIAEAALGAATPFTIGIFGAWGHGKTSLLNAARTLLEPVNPDGTITRPHPHVVTVQFNAWRYEKEAHPIVPLVASISKAVTQRLDHDKLFQQAIGEKGKALATAFCDRAMSLLSGLKLEVRGRLGNPIVGQVEGGASVDVGAAQENDAERQAEREKANQLRTQPFIDDCLYLSAFDDLAHLHASAKESGANQTGQAPVIVVFIDDLDRCRPEAAVEILEGIKLVLAQPGFVFVLALYREVIERYLERQSEVRYGDKHKEIGAGYIDKIVQLPLWLPSHEQAFESYIRRLVDTRLKPGLLPPAANDSDPAVKSANALLHAVYQCTPLLARLSSHSPRKLVRKINELLIDDRLLPADAHEAIKCKPEACRAIVFPLLLIQRALQELPLHQQMDALVANSDLCAVLATYRPDLADNTNLDDGIAPMLFREAINAKTKEAGPREERTEPAGSKSAPPVGDPALDKITAATARKWLKATDCLSQNEYRAVLLNTTAGRAWLANHGARRLVAKAIATQAASTVGIDSRVVYVTGHATGASEVAARLQVTTSPISEELRQEISIIERAVRRSLRFSAKAPIGHTEFGLVAELDLSGDPITDAGVAWLARPDTGFMVLETLHLGDTQVTDQGLVALAAEDGVLPSLTTLFLGFTRVSERGLAAIRKARPTLRIVH